MKTPTSRLNWFLRSYNVLLFLQLFFYDHLGVPAHLMCLKYFIDIPLYVPLCTLRWHFLHRGTCFLFIRAICASNAFNFLFSVLICFTWCISTLWLSPQFAQPCPSAVDIFQSLACLTPPPQRSDPAKRSSPRPAGPQQRSDPAGAGGTRWGGEAIQRSDPAKRSSEAIQRSDPIGIGGGEEV
jgi:hypothetical protein